MSALVLSLRLLRFATLLWAVRPAVPVQEPTISALQTLKELGEFTVTLSGQTFPSYPSQQPCLYGEWTVGKKSGDDWAERVATRHAGDSLHITTPKGAIDLRHGQVRLYVGGSNLRTYTRAAAATAPEFVRDLLADHAELTLEEVVLKAGTTYHARVSSESYWLPPSSSNGEPRRQQNLVLSISDLPFKDGKPQRPLAPSFLDIVY